MATYKSRVLSVRIDEELLRAVHERARAEGRSVSGQVVFFVREQIERSPERRQPAKKISGWLSRKGASPSYGDFRRGRAEASRKVRSAIRRKARK